MASCFRRSCSAGQDDKGVRPRVRSCAECALFQRLRVLKHWKSAHSRDAHMRDVRSRNANTRDVRSRGACARGAHSRHSFESRAQAAGSPLPDAPALYRGLHDVEEVVANVGRARAKELERVEFLGGEGLVALGLAVRRAGLVVIPQDVVGCAAQALCQRDEPRGAKLDAPALPRAVRRLAHAKIVGDFGLGESSCAAQLCQPSFVSLTHWYLLVWS